MNKILFFIDIRNRYLADDLKKQGGEGTKIILILVKITIAQHFITLIMIIFTRSGQLHEKVLQLKKQGKKIGFIPTMGALHEGHFSLVEACKSNTSIAVCSIFVNPAQFNDPTDFEKYPKTIEKDIHQLHNAQADILFLPSTEEIYPEGMNTGQHYNLGFLETRLEGFYRPGHFQGVCKVMHKLLSIVEPHELYMGQKDFQQCMVIKKLLSDQHIVTNFNIVPTMREISGLAMSSRNQRLSEAGKQQAATLYRALNHIKENFGATELNTLKQQAKNMMTDAGFEKIDYLEVCNPADLAPATNNRSFPNNAALTAAFIEGIRLIDNIIIN